MGSFRLIGTGLLTVLTLTLGQIFSSAKAGGNGQPKSPRSSTSLLPATTPTPTPSPIIPNPKNTSIPTQPADPLAAVLAIRDHVKILEERCDPILSAYSCKQKEAYSASANRLDQWSRHFSNCADAASAFRKDYAEGSPSVQVAIAWDENCLASFETRRSDLPRSPDAPSAHETLAGANQARLISAVGILEADSKTRCSGLLKAPNYFITSKHCLRNADPEGFRVSASNGAFMGRQARQIFRTTPGDAGVPGDWVVLVVEGITEHPIAETKLVQLGEPRSANVLGWYPYNESTEYVNSSPSQLSRLRYQHFGMCEAIQSSFGCLEIVCQTVRGFSGAPIFVGVDDQGVFEVVGLISGSDGNDAECPTSSNLPTSTLATSAERISVGE